MFFYVSSRNGTIYQLSKRWNPGETVMKISRCKRHFKNFPSLQCGDKMTKPKRSMVDSFSL